MEQDALISVIVPVYNVEAYLPRCVDSIMAQTYENLEIILVDDGAKDSSGKICDAYAEKDSRIKVIHKENGGLSSARNAGIDIAKGEYLAFVDSDDWIGPEMYETMLCLAQKYGASMVCAGRYDVDSATGLKTVGLCPVKEAVISGEEMLGRVFLWDQCDSSACDKLFARSLFRELRYPLGVISEDVAVFYRIAERADKVVMCPMAFYNYYHRENSITTAKLSDKVFCFQSHTDVIYPYVRDHHPRIEPQARYFRIRALMYSVMCVDLAEKQERRRYAKNCREARKALRSHMGFLLTAPYFGKQERLTVILLALEIYRPLRSLYHAFK